MSSSKYTRSLSEIEYSFGKILISVTVILDRIALDDTQNCGEMLKINIWNRELRWRFFSGISVEKCFEIVGMIREKLKIIMESCTFENKFLQIC